MNPENSYNFVVAMQVYSIIFRLLVVVCSCIPLIASAQQDTTVVVKDTLITLDTVPRKNSEQVDQIITFAKKFLGTPYKYAGSTPSGFDCSGFIGYVMGNFGISLARSSYSMAEFGRTVKLSEIRPGDLMFFKGSNVHSSQIGHVGMVIEVGPGMIKFIHSANTGVRIDNFINSKYYVPRFVKAKRLDYGEEQK
jgi:cell wall-associated NlpC family hydrolase